MRKLTWITLIILLIVLTACTNKEPTFEPTKNPGLELTKLSSKGITDQQPSDEAKQILSQYEEVSGVRAINHDGELLVAIDIKQSDRLSVKSLQRDLSKKLKDEFLNMDVHVSTDQKLLFEIEKIENALMNDSITKKEVGKKLKKLKKLMKERT